MNGHAIACVMVMMSMAMAMMAAESAAHASGAWKQTSGPAGGQVTGMTGDRSGTYLTLGQAGVFRSQDDGATWVRAGGQGIHPLAQINAVAVGSVLFAVVQPGPTLMRSIDQGETWQQTTLATEAPDAWQIDLKARGHELLVLAHRASGEPSRILRSIDGLTWTDVPAPPESAAALAVAGDGLIVTANFGITLYRTDDDGATWLPSGETLPGDLYQLDFGSAGLTVLRGGFGMQLFRSANGGETWEPLDDPTLLANGAQRYFQIGGTTVAHGSMGFVQSIDGGVTWSPLAAKGLPGDEALSVFQVGGVLWAAPDDGRVFRSIDAGEHWSLVHSGLIGSSIGVIGTDGTAIVGGGTYVPPNYGSPDGGTTWVETVPVTMRSFCNDQSGLLLGTAGSGVLRTTNGGATWTSMSAGLPLVQPFDTNLDPINAIVRSGNALFAGTGGSSIFIADGSHCACSGTASGAGVYRSLNNGASWQPVNTGLPINMVYLGQTIWRPIMHMLARSNTVLAGTGNHGVWRTTNLGASWSPTGGLPTGGNTSLLGLIEFNETLFASVNAAGPSSWLFTSTNDGVTWQPVTTNSSGPMFSMVVHDGALVAVGSDGGVFRSNDGSTWTADSGPIASVRVSSLASAGDLLVAGTNSRGVWAFEPLPHSPGDVNGDAVIGIADLLAVIGAWGPCTAGGGGGCAADVAPPGSPDGVIGIADLLLVIANWS